ncbi:hypothetical protein N7510_007721 [Penicillium lagena]|uniref:uncharacterized protein n=1 Tax=Penicillium lagena TaxID=94218 RepID=UPI0025407A54|nr:uncharacterized protein N7510_007721 [Penicillium lagena]KAJ5611002.1 hypothetical protein N7510_007721 [Penicillium lagena]
MDGRSTIPRIPWPGQGRVSFHRWIFSNSHHRGCSRGPIMDLRKRNQIGPDTNQVCPPDSTPHTNAVGKNFRNLFPGAGPWTSGHRQPGFRASSSRQLEDESAIRPRRTSNTVSNLCIDVGEDELQRAIFTAS